ncbi:MULTISPECIES: CPXCG motif-containing cysteine-rich protein [Pseudomonas]|jgi:transcription elongation factor Elf1|uniref:CPXCG motif-containing cysteine-rich protein n=1 Tax=Pseudomonas juntendi TaxID=2666183 RepID=A0A7W2JJ13_9PSED|nr:MULTISPECIES: CPXCG motif-containing cysteine-rich protein [Pseudomonas]NOY03056.1 CPXCG motif-containing cysteine-rich protein [Gammaproteobacteria bacterium]PPB15219.1 CPXCG motif-containing cysteine-rich protein [Pseudomonas aeruginosa]EGB99210.1 LITAF-like zinc ribbon domain containing protein [Pseudomonas sp. TJI-51]MBA6059921.1 CPXCG motif-containing cysteine-rich protein [Pseudomonas juntendi]MBA6100272.1 CPXCG motif-containing cysteine-rich protein [Pseudomonas juntendi]
MLETAFYDCPYCGEEVETTVDLSGGDQEYIEDCQVCCRPIRFVLQVHGEEWMLDVYGENE